MLDLRILRPLRRTNECVDCRWEEWGQQQFAAFPSSTQLLERASSGPFHRSRIPYPGVSAPAHAKAANVTAPQSLIAPQLRYHETVNRPLCLLTCTYHECPESPCPSNSQAPSHFTLPRLSGSPPVFVQDDSAAVCQIYQYSLYLLHNTE